MLREVELCDTYSSTAVFSIYPFKILMSLVPVLQHIVLLLLDLVTKFAF